MEGKSMYRSAEQSLVERMNEKLFEATTWYKKMEITEDTEEDKVIAVFSNQMRAPRKISGEKRNQWDKITIEGERNNKEGKKNQNTS